MDSEYFKEVFTIETKDHYLLARTASKHMDLGKVKKLAFILGNLMPDINPFSYLTKDSKNRLGGHSFTSRKTFIDEIWTSQSLSNFIDWFKAGEMMHYLTDSFTRPHNEAFNYPMKEHVAYEHALHKKFLRLVKEGTFDGAFESTEAIFNFKKWIEQQHDKYLSKSVDMEEDLEFIFHAYVTACCSFVETTEFGHIKIMGMHLASGE